MYQYTARFHYEASAMINGMLPYLLSKAEPNQQKQIKKCFSHYAVRRSVDSKWDSTQRCIVSAADKRLAELVVAQDMEDDEYYFPNTDTSAFELDMASWKDGKVQRPSAKKLSKDDDDYTVHDSVGTFVSRHEAKKTPPSASTA
jgi:hypothetical protein